MKTVKSLADLHRMALATGAEVVTPDGRFNSARAQVKPAPKPAPPKMKVTHLQEVPPPTVSPTPPILASPVPIQAQQPAELSFEIDYNSDGAIINVTVKVKP